MHDASWTAATDPSSLFEAWFADAEATEPDVPNAMQLATADASGQPTIRTVLLKGASPEGFTFYTNLDSRKGNELAANPRAALHFHWKTVRRQVRVRGTVVPVSGEEADAYWASRPRGSQIASWASAQSRPLASPAVYDQSVADVTARFEGEPVPRPPFWGGYRLVPTAMEFWQDGEYRMHTRLEFTKTETGWSSTLLQP